MTRIKPTLIVPTLYSLEEVDGTLAIIAAHKRAIALIEASMNERVDNIKAEANKECATHKNAIARLEQAILQYAQNHKQDVFTGKKSLALTFGTIGYRVSTKLKTLTKWTWERVLKTLQDKGALQFVRTKCEVDKEALKGMSPEHLAEVGVKAVSEDIFYYELQEQELGKLPDELARALTDPALSSISISA